MWWAGPSWDLRGYCCHSWQAQKDKMRCLAVEDKEGLLLTAGKPRKRSGKKKAQEARA
jgi:hypothetical protein